MRANWRRAILSACVLTVAAGCGERDAPVAVGRAQAALTQTTVTTDLGTYTYGQHVTVSYSGMSGAALDWVSIAPEGSPDTSYKRYAFTGGALSGTVDLGAVAPGSYVARAYFDNSYVIEAESEAFTVLTSAT